MAASTWKVGVGSTVSTATALTLNTTTSLRHYIFTGTSLATWTLPTPTEALAGVTIMVSHRGTSGLAVVSDPGTIIDGQAAVSAVAMIVLRTRIFVCDGTYWLTPQETILPDNVLTLANTAAVTGKTFADASNIFALFDNKTAIVSNGNPAKQVALAVDTSQAAGTIVVTLPKTGGTTLATTADIPNARSNVQVVSAAVTLPAQPRVVLILAGGAPELPTAVDNLGLRYTFKNLDSAAKAVLTTSSQTIDGATSLTVPPGAAVDVMSDGSNWAVL